MYELWLFKHEDTVQQRKRGKVMLLYMEAQPCSLPGEMSPAAEEKCRFPLGENSTYRHMRVPLHIL